jgi:uncharacterized membrane protein
VKNNNTDGNIREESNLLAPENADMSPANHAATPPTSRKLLLRLTLSGAFAALILVATLFLGVPTALGYINMGDGVILLASYLLGPFAFFPAAIGSALADLLKGYTVYIPATFAIKGLMGLAAGFIMKKENVSFVRKLLAFAVAETIMIIGYFAFETLLYGANAASFSALWNLVQGAVGMVIAMLLCVFLEKLRWNTRTRV